MKMRTHKRFAAVRSLAGVALGLSAWVTFGACAKNSIADVAIFDPNDLRPQAQFAQLAVFEGGCPADKTLAYGDISGAKQVQTVLIENEFGDLDDLKKGDYGFAVLLRRADCAVVATGCTPVDLNIHRHIGIQVDPVVPPAGACDTSAGLSCNVGVCTASSAP